MKVAFMYDFDGTLSPLNMQEYNFIPALNMTSSCFWDEVNKLKVKKNMDPVLAYMYLMIKKAKEKDISITKSAFTSYGKNIELFNGVIDFFDNINEYAKGIGIYISHYIISSGIKEIIEGSKISNKFDRIYASSFLYNVDNIALWPATSINYTNKTQIIYRINKGIYEIYDDNVNTHMDDDKKNIKFGNMVYFGDGLTDVPCMKLVKINGGISIAVYPDKDNISVATKLLKDKRVNDIFKADYSKDSELFNYLKNVLKSMKEKEDAKKNEV